MNLPAQRILANIEKGKLSPGYLLLGREIYWRDRIWTALRRALGMEGRTDALVELDLRQGPVDQVVERARERNLWAQQQLILVRNAQGLSATKGLPSVTAYFEDPSPFSVLVFEMTDVDLGTEDWREKEKIKTRLEAWEGICDVALLAAPDLAECVEVVQRECAARGRKISPQAAESLAALLDRDLGRMIQELEKLCLYNPEGKEITEEEVYSVVGSRTAPTGLSLTEAIGSGDAGKALEVVAEAMRRGAYLPLVISELARTLRQLLLLQESNARDPGQAAKILWAARLPAPPHSLRELLRLARAFPREHLARSFQLAFQADLALRSSPADERLVLERFVLQLAKPSRVQQPAGVRP